MPIRFFRYDRTVNIKRRETSVFLQEVISGENKNLDTVHITFCSDDFLLETNKSFLHHDYYTDVITFDYSTDSTLSGEILISIDRVKENSQALDVSFIDELHRVMIHGLLHLCGYDDRTKKEMKEIRERENYWLKVLKQKADGLN